MITIDCELDNVSLDEAIKKVPSKDIYVYVTVKTNYQDGLIVYFCSSHKEYLKLYAMLRQYIVRDNFILEVKANFKKPDDSYKTINLLRDIKSIYKVILN